MSVGDLVLIPVAVFSLLSLMSSWHAWRIRHSMDSWLDVSLTVSIPLLFAAVSAHRYVVVAKGIYFNQAEIALHWVLSVLMVGLILRLQFGWARAVLRSPKSRERVQ